jgi:hypothetical protein
MSVFRQDDVPFEPVVVAGMSGAGLKSPLYQRDVFPSPFRVVPVRAGLPVLARLRDQGSYRPPNVIGHAGSVIAKPHPERFTLAVVPRAPDLGPDEGPVGAID